MPESDWSPDVWSDHWSDIRDAVQSRWGDLTNEDLEGGGGDATIVRDLLTTRYGFSQEEAEKMLEEMALDVDR